MQRALGALVLILAALQCRYAAGQGYPECIEENVVLRHAGAHGIFVDVRAFGASGCWQKDCSRTDKFHVRHPGVCARACSEIDECTHWSVGEQDEGKMKCFLRKSDGGREEAGGWISAPKACAPPPLPYAFLALVASEMEDLKACDAGKGPRCPDMSRAMATWRFAISSLQKGAADIMDDNSLKYLEMISGDTDAFMAQMSEENMPVVIANNREVFNAFRGFMETQPKVDLTQVDLSFPNPLHGTLCGPLSCYVTE